MMRRKGNVDKERVATDPKFVRSRESSKELSYASRPGKLIRDGIKDSVPGAEKGTTNNRLNKRLTALVKEDNIHQWG